MLSTYLSLCAEFYEITKPVAPKDAYDFYRSYAKEARGRILEPMCGTGRFLIPLCQEGFEVHGFDASEPMLNFLHSKAAKISTAFKVWKSSIEDAAIAGSYALIFIPAGSFGFIGCLQQLTNNKKFWPEPHNVLFDLKKTTKGAGWIRDAARRAKKILKTQTGKPILAHTDWRVENLAFANEKLVAVFDWDSLGEMTELELVGRVAAQFTTNFALGIKVTPEPSESRSFLSEYEHYRQKRFSDADKVTISAAADDLIAHIARLEHALGKSGANQYQILLRKCKGRSFLFSDD